MLIGLNSDHLARVHDIKRVNARLERAHQSISGTMLIGHVFDFATTDAVLAGDCAAALGRIRSWIRT